MENVNLNYWRMKNEDYAAITTFYQVRGYLKATGETIKTQDLLDYIERTLVEEKARLNKQFPEKKTHSRER